MENQGLDPDDIVKTKDEIKADAQDPIKQRLDELAIQKQTLENEEIRAKVGVQNAEINKIDAAIKNDEELLRLKGLELQGKEIEAAARLELEEKKIDADIEAGKTEVVAGEKKTSVGATRKTSKNDALQTNNK
jgi:hypothetical protein